MLSITSTTPTGRTVQHNLHSLRLPGGVLAHTLDGAELYRQLAGLSVPDIDVAMGVQDLPNRKRRPNCAYIQIALVEVFRRHDVP